MYITDGKLSFDDWDMLTWSLGWTGAFEPSGGVARYIRTRRLAQLRTLLAQPDEGGRIADLAYRCGFSSESDCSRAFKVAYGLSPSEFRRLGREEGGQDALPRQSFAGWWNDLR